MEVKDKIDSFMKWTITWTHLVAMGPPLDRTWKSSTGAFVPSGRTVLRFPLWITNFLLKWERNFRFSCCCKRNSMSVWILGLNLHRFITKESIQSRKSMVRSILISMWTCIPDRFWQLPAYPQTNLQTSSANCNLVKKEGWMYFEVLCLLLITLTKLSGLWWGQLTKWFIQQKTLEGS